MKRFTHAALMFYALSVFSPVFLTGNFLFFSATKLHAEQEKKSSKKDSKKDRKNSKKNEEANTASAETDKSSSAGTDATQDAKLNDTAKDPVIEGINNYNDPQPEETSYGWLMFKAFIVIGLLAAGFWYFFKFIMKKTGLPNVGTQAVKVLAVTPLGQNKSLNVVDIGGHLFLLGVTDSNINLITEIQNREDIDRIKLLSSKSTPVKDQNFAQFLADQIGGVSRLIRQAKSGSTMAKPKNETRYHEEDAEDVHEKYDYLKQQKDRLKRMSGDDRYE